MRGSSKIPVSTKPGKICSNLNVRNAREIHRNFVHKEGRKMKDFSMKRCVKGSETNKKKLYKWHVLFLRKFKKMMSGKGENI